MAHFNRDVLNELRDRKEISIRTDKHPDTAVVIWVVAIGEEIFVRSFRGPKGRWYRDLASGGPATLEFGGRSVPVQARPANASDTVARVSEAFLAKYQPSSYARAMIEPGTLPTTLRLDPR